MENNKLTDSVNSCSLVDEGGDWDRRNRLKAYQGLHFLSIRNFKAGGELLLDTVSTFTATELIDYDGFVTLCVLAGVLTLQRNDLKKKVSSHFEVSRHSGGEQEIRNAYGRLVCYVDHRIAGSHLSFAKCTDPRRFRRFAIQMRIRQILPVPGSVNS